MAEKKSLVIKIKRPTLNPETDIQPVVVTQWHKPRIAMAVLIVLGLLAAGGYWLVGKQTGENRQPEPASAGDNVRLQAPAAQQYPSQAGRQRLPAEERATAAEKEQMASTSQVKSAHAIAANGSKQRLNEALPVNPGGRVERALLTQTLIGGKPGKAMPGTVTVSGNRSVMIYYFTELRGITGQKIYHQWLRDGKLVAQNELKVAADHWRTYSHRRVTAKLHGLWRVRTTDEQDKVLNEQSFQVR